MFLTLWFEIQGKKCVSLRKKAIKRSFKKATTNGVMDNQALWKLNKPFLSNKGGLEGNDISLVKEDKIITDNQK